jgi:hypothetical protein
VRDTVTIQVYRLSQIAASLTHNLLVSTHKHLKQAINRNIGIVNTIKVKARIDFIKSDKREIVLRISRTSLLEGTKQVQLREQLHLILPFRSVQDNMK